MSNDIYKLFKEIYDEQLTNLFNGKGMYKLFGPNKAVKVISKEQFELLKASGVLFYDNHNFGLSNINKFTKNIFVEKEDMITKGSKLGRLFNE